MTAYLKFERLTGYINADRRLHTALCLGLTLLISTLYFRGIQGDLPYIPEVDEPTFVVAAGRIAQTGDLNPGWFGHPGSTIVYPLAVFYRLWNLLQGHTVIFTGVYALPWDYRIEHAPYYSLGRLLSVGYLLISVPLLYQLGRRLGGVVTGLAGTAFFAASLPVLFHVQITRTDGAGIFFTLLSIWLLFKAKESEQVRWYGLAGLAIGLGVATRYFMITLWGLAGMILLAVLWQGRAVPGTLQRVIKAGFLTATGTLTGFLATTPFFLIDLPTAVEQISVEARSTHLGADGFTPWQNFLWYVSSAIPDALSWPQMALMGLGILGLLWQAQSRSASPDEGNSRTASPGTASRGAVSPAADLGLLLGFALIYLVAISISALHWQRWLIQILPVFTLLAGAGIVALGRLVGEMSQRTGMADWLRLAVTGTAMLAAFWLGLSTPLTQSIHYVETRHQASTRVEARQWVEANLPPGSRIAQEWFSLPAAGLPLQVTEYDSLVNWESIEGYQNAGFDYLVVSSWVYGNYFNEPDRYSEQVQFYQSLFNDYSVAQRLLPQGRQGGPTLWIIDIRPGENIPIHDE